MSEKVCTITPTYETVYTTYELFKIDRITPKAFFIYYYDF